MAISIENAPTPATRTRTQTPTAYLKSAYDAQKIGEFFAVKLETLKILPNFNKRIDYDLESLKEYINLNGIKFPPLRLMYVDGEMYIDEGHRRYAACVELGLPGDTPIPVYIGEASSPVERLSRQITSNSGKNYDFVERVAVVKELIQQYHLDQTEVAKLIGKSQGAVSAMTKFFVYSNLLMSAITKGDIKYTRVQDFQKKGLNENQILAIIAKEKHNDDDSELIDEPISDDSVVVEPTDDSVVIDEPTDDLKLPDPISDDLELPDSSKNPVVPGGSLSDKDKQKLQSLLDSKEKTTKTLKNAGNSAAATFGAQEKTLKKTNAAKLLTDFISSATIVENADGTVSYIVSKAEHKAFLKGADNV
jgi:predicted transcriptional regulator